jgi:hypothetical protein
MQIPMLVAMATVKSDDPQDMGTETPEEMFRPALPVPETLISENVRPRATGGIDFLTEAQNGDMPHKLTIRIWGGGDHRVTIRPVVSIGGDIPARDQRVHPNSVSQPAARP